MKYFKEIKNDIMDIKKKNYQKELIDEKIQKIEKNLKKKKKNNLLNTFKKDIYKV